MTPDPTRDPLYRLIYGATVIAASTVLVGMHIAQHIRATWTELTATQADRRARSRWTAELERWDQAQMDAVDQILGDDE